MGAIASPPGLVLAYIGIGPGQELFPYFLALLGLVGAALTSILHWPLSILYRLFSRRKGESGSAPAEGKEIVTEAGSKPS
jgi:hypothetical protein